MTNHPNDPLAEDHVEEIVLRMISDKDFKDLVESSFTWSGVMWTIAKELIGDKAVDILAGVVGAKNLRDAIKALKNNDWIEFTFEVSQLVLNNTPVGKFLKILVAGSEMYKFAKKVEKIWDKIGGAAENTVEQMWNIVSKYGNEIRTNSDLIGGIIKTINRGLKSVDEVMDNIPSFTQMSKLRMKHILHGDNTGGLHHVSGLVKNPNKVVSHHWDKADNGVYKIIYDGKSSTMFPDSWNEIETATSIKHIFDNYPTQIIASGKPFKTGTINGVEKRVDLFTDGKVKTAYPIFN